MRTIIVLSVAIVGTAACSSDDPVEPGPGAVTAVFVTPVQIEIPGQGSSLSASARDSNGTSIAGQTFEWSSSDASVATVSSSGVALAIGVGTATITATTSGVSGSAEVEVTGITSINFLPGDWNLTVDGAQESTAVTFRGLGGEILEEIRRRDGSEVLRGLTRLDGRAWLYVRADAERRRMQYFTGGIESGLNRAAAESVDGMNRVVIESVTTVGFTLRLQRDENGAWVNERTEVFAR